MRRARSLGEDEARSLQEKEHRRGRMPRGSLVALLLWVLLPLPGLAQAPVAAPPLVPVPSESDQEDPYGGYEEDAPPENTPPGELIPHDSRASGTSRGRARLLPEALFGLGAGFAGLAPGVFLGFVLAASDDSSGSGPVIGVISMGFVGVTLGAALGVTGGGNLMGGEGRFLETLAGAALGALTGGLLAIPTAFASDFAWVVPLFACPVIGAMIGYEATHAREQERKAAAAGTGVSMVPIISVRSSGGIVAGLAGHF